MSQREPDKQQREEERLDPEELLKRYHLRDSDLMVSRSSTPAAGTETAQPQERRQGRLRVYLGAPP